MCQNNASWYEYADPGNQANRNQYRELQGSNHGIFLGKTLKCEGEFCYLQKPKYFKKQCFRHHFYLPKVTIQVQNDLEYSAS